MKLIYDRDPITDRFPFTRFLETVQEVFGCSDSSIIQVKKLGGCGELVYERESALDVKFEAAFDEKPSIPLSFEEVKRIESVAGNVFDEFHGKTPNVEFGIFDATFMFVMSQDRGAENAVARHFSESKDSPDLTL